MWRKCGTIQWNWDLQPPDPLLRLGFWRVTVVTLRAPERRPQHSRTTWASWDWPQRVSETPHLGGRIFPIDASITRLVGAVLLELDEHCQLEGRRMFTAESMDAIPSLEDLPALLAAYP